MKDIQAEKSGFPVIPISKVGIRNIELPIWIKNHEGDFISAIANVSSYCDLVEDVKGINMSRIPRTIFDVFKPSKKKLVTELASDVVHRLKFAHEAEDIFFKAKFKYPLYQTSPMTELPSPEIINVTIETSLIDGVERNYLTVEMVGMSLCPCSKEMSMLKNNLTEEEATAIYYSNLPDSLMEKINAAGFGAHNQKSYVNVKVEIKRDKYFDLEELVQLINTSVSAKVFSVLKRPDEKYVTEMSYMGKYIDEDMNLCDVPEANSGPKFVEDIARQVAENLNENHLGKSIQDYVIVVRNEESIHSNEIEAVAVLNAGRNLR